MKLVSRWRLLLQCSAAGMIRYTKKARAVVFYAYEQANRERSKEVTAEHLLVGLLRADESLAGLIIEPLCKELAKAPSECRTVTDVVLSASAKEAILLAAGERERLGHKHTGTEHLLLGISGGSSEAAETLKKRGLSINYLRDLLSHRSLAGRTLPSRFWLRLDNCLTRRLHVLTLVIE